VECVRGGDRGLPPEAAAGGGRFFDSAPLPCHQVTRENAASASPPTAPMRSAPRRTATGPRRRRGSRKGTSDARLRFGCPMSRFGPPPACKTLRTHLIADHTVLVDFGLRHTVKPCDTFAGRSSRTGLSPPLPPRARAGWQRSLRPAPPGSARPRRWYSRRR